MPISEHELEAIGRKAWPTVASVSVQPIVAGRGRANEFDAQAGFTLTACDAAGSIVKRLTAESLDMLKGKVERQMPKQKQ